jgi:hypothetical protein
MEMKIPAIQPTLLTISPPRLQQIIQFPNPAVNRRKHPEKKIKAEPLYRGSR